MGNKVDLCGVDTGALPTLSGKASRQLFEAARQGDAQAREQFVFGNLRLVLSVVHRFARRCDSMDDLFQVGCIGLIKAADNFDPDMGVCFSTYAVPMIIGEIRRYLRDNNSVRVSRSVRDTAYKALQAIEKLSFQNGREPTLDEVAKETGIQRGAIAAALEAIQEPVSIYEPVYHDGGDAVYVADQLADSAADCEGWLNSIALTDAVKNLEKREKSIIYLRYYKGLTQMEIAGEIGISQAQVSRLEKNALERIKKQI